tara:strand:+ start:896 stop:1474 length:579 start_codon:yes stop_codon:yes gene_type:complete
MADPTALYSYKGVSPTTLPHKIRPAEGVVRTDVSTFTDAELTDAGYTGPYTIPSHNSETQRVTWDSENLAFVVEDISDGELWSAIRTKRNRLLSESDWTMISDSPKTLNYYQWEKYRQALRDLTSDFSDPKSITWPESPQGKSDSDFEETRLIEKQLRERVRETDTNLESTSASLISLRNELISLNVGIATT